MLRNLLVLAAVSCVVFDAVRSLPVAQHRFSFPSHFSFRTIHVPVPAPIAPKPGRLIQPTVPEQSPSHIPVMVAVPEDFQGDSVIISSDDLRNMGLNGAITNIEQAEPVEAPVQEPEAIVEETVLPEIVAEQETIVDAAPQQQEIIVNAEPEQVVEEVAPEPQDVIVEVVPAQQEIILEEVPVETLAQIDDAFTLTDTETVSVVEPEPLISEPVVMPEIVPQRVQETHAAPISPFDTDTFHAYNNFLNTWLQLASVNLNRPDLLRYVNNVAPRTEAPQVQQSIFVKEVPVEAPIPVQEQPIEQVIVEVAEPMIEEVVAAEPAIAEPVSEVEEPMVSEMVPEPVTETMLLEEEIVTEIPADIFAVEETIDITTLPPMIEEPKIIVKEQKNPVSGPPTPRPVVLPEISPADIQKNTIAKSISSNVPVSQNIAFSDPAPALLQQVPTFSSRGRFSGYRYSFSHVPQRGSFVSHHG